MNIINKQQIIGKVIHRLPVVNSTNTHVLNLLRKEKLNNGDVFWAEKQTTGRGQAGNTWISNDGLNLTFSIVLFPSFLPTKHIFALNMIVSLALQRVLTKQLSQKITIKWPNDILVEEKKMAGILIENSIIGNRIAHSIIGIGLNVNQLVFPGLPQAISMKLLTGQDFNRDILIEEICICLDGLYQLLAISGYQKLQQEYTQHLFALHEERAFLIADKIFKGTVQGVNALGHLLVNVNGVQKAFQYKEIAFLFGK